MKQGNLHSPFRCSCKNSSISTDSRRREKVANPSSDRHID
jgi:hypothetical protein